jgi:hypothetical protein
MPFAIKPETDDGPARGVGATESGAWDNAGLDAQERLTYKAVTITEESFRKALADPTPEEQRSETDGKGGPDSQESVALAKRFAGEHGSLRRLPMHQCDAGPEFLLLL